MTSLVEVVAVYVGASLISVHVVAQPEPDVRRIRPVRVRQSFSGYCLIR
jgi:hypothetical protein